MRYVNYILGAVVVFAPAAAKAQSISGEIAIHSQYLDDDLLPLTDEPVIQAGLYLDVGDHCSLDVWGNHGFNTSMGGELDLGGSCRFSSGDTEIEISANRYILRGTSDITAVSISATHGPFDVTVNQYLWDNNPDATRITAGYSFEPIDKFTLRPSLVYQTGFGERDVFGGGITGTYAISDQLSLIGTVLTPFKGDRSTQAGVGISFKF